MGGWMDERMDVRNWLSVGCAITLASWDSMLHVPVEGQGHVAEPGRVPLAPEKMPVGGIKSGQVAS